MDDSEEDEPGLAINLPLLLARMEARNGKGNSETEDENGEDGNLSDRS